MPLPTALSSFVGREREVRLLIELLTRGDVRLLTLTGPGGVGKTRLAWRVGEKVAVAYDDVRFVPLAAIRDPDLVCQPDTPTGQRIIRWPVGVYGGAGVPIRSRG